MCESVYKKFDSGIKPVNQVEITTVHYKQNDKHVTKYYITKIRLTVCDSFSFLTNPTKSSEEYPLNSMYSSSNMLAET